MSGYLAWGTTHNLNDRIRCGLENSTDDENETSNRQSPFTANWICEISKRHGPGETSNIIERHNGTSNPYSQLVPTLPLQRSAILTRVPGMHQINPSLIRHNNTHNTLVITKQERAKRHKNSDRIKISCTSLPSLKRVSTRRWLYQFCLLE